MFGNIDHMMKQMRSNLKPIGFGDISDGRFEQHTHVSSTKMQNGRQVEEKYSTKAQGALKNGQRLVERQQMYENTETGL